jgi:hypothetical protein
VLEKILKRQRQILTGGPRRFRFRRLPQAILGILASATHYRHEALRFAVCDRDFGSHLPIYCDRQETFRPEASTFKDAGN